MPRASTADRTTGLRRTTRSESEGPQPAAGNTGTTAAAKGGTTAKGRKAQAGDGQCMAVRTPSVQELRSTAVKHRIVAPRQPGSRGRLAKRTASAERSSSSAEEEEALAAPDSDSDDSASEHSEKPAAAARKAPARKRAAAAMSKRYGADQSEHLAAHLLVCMAPVLCSEERIVIVLQNHVQASKGGAQAATSARQACGALRR